MCFIFRSVTVLIMNRFSHYQLSEYTHCFKMSLGITEELNGIDLRNFSNEQGFFSVSWSFQEKLMYSLGRVPQFYFARTQDQGWIIFGVVFLFGISITGRLYSGLIWSVSLNNPRYPFLPLQSSLLDGFWLL